MTKRWTNYTRPWPPAKASTASTTTRPHDREITAAERRRAVEDQLDHDEELDGDWTR